MTNTQRRRVSVLGLALFFLLSHVYQFWSGSFEISTSDRDPSTETPLQLAPSTVNGSVVTHPTNATPVSTSSKLCTREQIREGSWQPVELARVPYVSKTKHLRCYPDDYYKQKPWKTWEWTPFNSECTLSTWNVQDFCDLLPYVTVSIIGDSLSWEMYSSLLQLSGQRVYQNSQHRSKQMDQNHAQWACDKKTKIVWRNDRRLYKLTDSIEADFPLVLVLNRGAHWVNDARTKREFATQLEEIRAWRQKCDDRGIKCHLFWRTSVPGHPGCGNFTGPVADRGAMESMILNRANYNNHTLTYNWFEYQHQNLIFLEMLAESGIEHEVIDAYDINVLRPDEHRAHQGDCLHNCYPGKMDVYAQLLLHYLKMQRSKDDIDTLTNMATKYFKSKEID